MTEGSFKTAAFLAVGWLMLSPGMFGQKGPPPQNDPEVHYSFFVFMKVTPAELPKVIDACRVALSELKAIETQSQAHWRGGMQNGKAADSVTVRQFSALRQAAIQAGRVRLQQALSAASWSTLQAHINGEHRLSIQRFR